MKPKRRLEPHTFRTHTNANVPNQKRQPRNRWDTGRNCPSILLRFHDLFQQYPVTCPKEFCRPVQRIRCDIMQASVGGLDNSAKSVSHTVNIATLLCNSPFTATRPLPTSFCQSSQSSVLAFRHTASKASRYLVITMGVVGLPRKGLSPEKRRKIHQQKWRFGCNMAFFAAIPGRH